MLGSARGYCSSGAHGSVNRGSRALERTTEHPAQGALSSGVTVQPVVPLSQDSNPWGEDQGHRGGRKVSTLNKRHDWVFKKKVPGKARTMGFALK